MDPNQQQPYQQQPYQQEPPLQVKFSNLKMNSLNTKQCLHNKFLTASPPWVCQYSQHHLDTKVNLLLSSSSKLPCSQMVGL